MSDAYSAIQVDHILDLCESLNYTRAEIRHAVHAHWTEIKIRALVKREARLSAQLEEALAEENKESDHF